MQRIRVRSNLHQTAGGNFMDLRPGYKTLTRHWQAAEIHRAIGRRVHPDTHWRQYGRPLIGFEDRQNAGVKAAVTVIETQQHGLIRQRRAALTGRQQLIHRHRLITVGLEPGQLFNQVGGAHRHIGLAGIGILDVVIGQRQHLALRPRAFAGRLRTLLRRSEGWSRNGASTEQHSDQPEQAAAGEETHGGNP